MNDSGSVFEGMRLFLLVSLWKWQMKVLVTQSCPTLCDPVDCSPPSSSVNGMLQARILEWVAIPFSKDLPNPGIGSPARSMGSGLLGTVITFASIFSPLGCMFWSFHSNEPALQNPRMKLPLLNLFWALKLKWYINSWDYNQLIFIIFLMITYHSLPTTVIPTRKSN